ncbi:MAG: hypothetical protein RIR66_268 [Actinomycetota bacterium]
MEPELIIFDCDGVLVNSEHIAVRIDQEFLLEIGIHMTPEEIIENFVGKSDEYFQNEIEKLNGTKLPSNWKSDLASRYHQAFLTELQPVEGVLEVLESVKVPICVASSGSQKKIRISLELTGLIQYFGENIFSAEQVNNGKPEPELFLFAAAKMGVDPARAVVVEDSRAGVQAGLAAQMQVFAYSGSVTPKDRLQLPGATIFDKMEQLLPAINALTAK